MADDDAPESNAASGRILQFRRKTDRVGVVGYQPANRSIGEEWMLLDVGLTVRDKVPDFTMTRDLLSVETPDGKTIPLATIPEFRAANTQALQNRAKAQRDSINYFPPDAARPCRIGFFTDLSDRAVAWDQFDVSSDRACVGRLYFHIPGGITYGQHWLNVKFPKSLVRVPFRILTEEEEKTFSKNYKSISQQVKDCRFSEGWDPSFAKPFPPELFTRLTAFSVP
jgi:hypothetical protein